MDPKEEIKNKLDIVDVISGYIRLQKAGQNYKANCPFHKEKTASFYVSPSKQIWHCFGCNKGGDIFTFVMEIEHIDFLAALKILAEKANIELNQRSFKENSEQKICFDIHKIANDLYVANLKKNPPAIKYLKDRGLTNETIEKFQIGFASDEWKDITSLLLKKFKPNHLVNSGLCILKNSYQNVSVIKDTMIYDRFRSRIMFPIFNTSNQVIGYTARIFGDNLKTIKDIKQTGKYVNSPQTIIYDKSKNLFGIKQAKTAILQKDSVILTEGPIDMIACFQEGIENVVASLGTALTLDQLKLLKRYTSNIILAYDMDEAGQKAIERSIEIALKEGFNLKIISLPQGKDIAEFVLTNKGKLKEIIDSAKSVMHFYLKRANSMYDKKTLKGKKDILNYVLGKLKNISNIIDRAYWVEKIANFLKIESSLVEELLSQIKETESYIEEKDLEEKNISRHEMLSENVLTQFLLFKIPKEKIIENKKYFHEKYQFAIDLIKNDLIDDAIKQKNLKEQGFDLTKEEYIMLSGIDLKTGQEDPKRNLFDYSLKQLQKEYIKNQINHLQKEIKIAEKNQNQGKLEELLKEFQFLTNKLKK